MAGLRPGHPRLSCGYIVKTWMPGTRPGMTNFSKPARRAGKRGTRTLYWIRQLWHDEATHNYGGGDANGNAAFKPRLPLNKAAAKPCIVAASRPGTPTSSW